MPQLFDNHITLFQRDYQSQGNGLATVTVDNLSLTVPDHDFWKKFAQGWEPDTERIYQSSIQAGSTVLDIGAWIGPTLLFSLACGGEKIIAVEPNPISFSALEQIIKLNPHLEEKVTLLHQAISDKPGNLKMGLVEGESDTSTFGVQGDAIEVQTTTIDSLVDHYNLNQIDLIKIDIEGAEVLLHEDLAQLSQKPEQKIHLSIHVPFFPDSADKLSFAQAFENFAIFDDRGDQLSHETLTLRLLTQKTHPDWGTKHGNFFEVFLIAK